MTGCREKPGIRRGDMRKTIRRVGIRTPIFKRAFVYNWTISGTARCVNTKRPLTRLLDCTERGLAMKATQQPFADPRIGAFPGDASWRPVPAHSGYFVTAAGDIRGPRKILRPMRAESGHLYVLTPLPRRPRKLFVHRAVLLAFAGPPKPGQEVRHLDGNPANNRWAPGSSEEEVRAAGGNLFWGTRLENSRDKTLHGTECRGEDKPDARLTEVQVLAIRDDPRASRVVGAEYGVSHTAILRIRRGDRWRAA